MRKDKQQAGLVKLIILIIVAVLVLSYFGINIQKIAESDTGKANFAYVWEIFQKVGGWFLDLYQKYLAEHVAKIWSYFPENLIK